MVILGIETSCDETAAAVLEKKGEEIRILSNIIASSSALQAKYGGIIPEQAAREQIKAIVPVIEESLQVSGYRGLDLDAIAVTQGPGLIGSLLVGVETAKTLAAVWQKPLIPVNHLIGHFYANWIQEKVPRDTFDTLPTFPLIGLLVSGGHTDLVLFKDHGKYQYLGGTRDDAAGECFDKCARLLGLPYPGGPEISKLAKKGNPKSFNLPRPMLDSDDFDFSYSGLKTAVANLVSSGRRLPPKAVSPRPDVGGRIRGPQRPQDASVGEQVSGAADWSDWRPDKLSDLCSSIEQAIVDPLVKKTLKAAKQYKVKTIILGGGVAANQKLREQFQHFCNLLPVPCNLFVPPPHLCTDNAAMIASAAFFAKPIANVLQLQANPNLSL